MGAQTVCFRRQGVVLLSLPLLVQVLLALPLVQALPPLLLAQVLLALHGGGLCRGKPVLVPHGLQPGQLPPPFPRLLLLLLLQL